MLEGSRRHQPPGAGMDSEKRRICHSGTAMQSGEPASAESSSSACGRTVSTSLDCFLSMAGWPGLGRDTLGLGTNGGLLKQLALLHHSAPGPMVGNCLESCCKHEP